MKKNIFILLFFLYTVTLLLADQVVHAAQIGTPLINVSYSNDTKGSFPWADYVLLIPKLRNGSGNLSGWDSDRYRTASGRIRVGLFELGFFLHTGEATDYYYNKHPTANDSTHFTGGNLNETQRYNGIIYTSFGGFKLGWNSEQIRNIAHNIMRRGKSPYFRVLNISPSRFYSVGTHKPYTV